MKIHYLQHVKFENLGAIADWAKACHCSVSCTELYKPDPVFPDHSDYDLLIIMGGPMGVNDVEAHPWLIEEKKFIQNAIASDKYVLGICLGAQLIAASLGSNIAANKYTEIGWFPITFTDTATEHRIFSELDTSIHVLHWHGDRFEIPAGAMRIASSEACDNQGFLYGEKVLGLQCHLEMTVESLSELVKASESELTSEKYIQTKEQLLRETYFSNSLSALYTILDNWLAL